MFTEKIFVPKDFLSNYINRELNDVHIYALCLSQKHTVDYADVVHSSHCMEFVLSGSMEINNGNVVQILDENDINFRRRGNYQIKLSAGYSSVAIFLDDEFIYNFLEDHVMRERKSLFLNNPSLTFNFTSTAYIKASCDELIKLIGCNHAFASTTIRLIGQQLLLQLLVQDRRKLLLSYLSYLASRPKLDLGYYMERHFTEKCNLQSLAANTGRSVSSFKAEFWQQFKTSPMKWLIKRRLIHANLLISGSDENISIIGYQCGFENLSHFSRAYKQQFGYPPSETRHILAAGEKELIRPDGL